MTATNKILLAAVLALTAALLLGSSPAGAAGAYANAAGHGLPNVACAGPLPPVRGFTVDMTACVNGGSVSATGCVWVPGIPVACTWNPDCVTVLRSVPPAGTVVVRVCHGEQVA